MKIINRYSFLLFSLIGLMTSCGSDEGGSNNNPTPDPEPEVKVDGTIVFEINNADLAHDDLSENSTPFSIVISLLNEEDDTETFTSETFELTAVPFGFKTEDITLLEGDYSLTEYLILNSENKVIYATPKSTSPLASEVNDPLPIAINVVGEETTSVSPEVLSTASIDPEELGYATFELNIVETMPISIGVMIYNYSSKSFELTAASLTIDDTEKTLIEKELENKTSHLVIQSNVEEYIIQIKKEGYEGFVKTYSNSELKVHNSENPLLIQLQEVIN